MKKGLKITLIVLGCILLAIALIGFGIVALFGWVWGGMRFSAQAAAEAISMHSSQRQNIEAVGCVFYYSTFAEEYGIADEASELNDWIYYNVSAVQKGDIGMWYELREDRYYHTAYREDKEEAAAELKLFEKDGKYHYFLFPVYSEDMPKEPPFTFPSDFDSLTVNGTEYELFKHSYFVTDYEIEKFEINGVKYTLKEPAWQDTEPSGVIPVVNATVLKSEQYNKFIDKDMVAVGSKEELDALNLMIDIGYDDAFFKDHMLLLIQPSYQPYQKLVGLSALNEKDGRINALCTLEELESGEGVDYPAAFMQALIAVELKKEDVQGLEAGECTGTVEFSIKEIRKEFGELAGMKKPSNEDIIAMMKKYPEYFDLTTDKGLEVYVWNENDKVFCGVLYGTNRSKTKAELEGLMANGATIEEMKIILYSYGEEVSFAVLPIKYFIETASE